MEFSEIMFIALIGAFILQFIDASFGMGYGSITPFLIILGFSPLESVIAVIFSSVFLSLLTGILHHVYKNVDFSKGSESSKIAKVLGVTGILGAIIGVLIVVELPKDVLEAYIGLIVLVIGVAILIKRKKKSKFSWAKIIGLGSFAAINQGMSGGGYGPVLAGGQILSGVQSKKAVSITALTEGIISIVAILSFLVLGKYTQFNWSLILYMLVGGLISTPLAIYFVRKSKPEKLRLLIAIISILMGLSILVKFVI